MIELVNCTTNKIRIDTDQYSYELSRATPAAAKVQARTEQVGVAENDIPCILRTDIVIEHLPAPKENTLFIVSIVCAISAWAEGRVDCVTIDASHRDTDGALKCNCVHFGPFGYPVWMEE